MDPVKRRLVYVADESETLLSELSGTPPTRQSRMTRLLVPLSPPTSPPTSKKSPSPLPRPLSTAALLTRADTADPALLVSYNGFLLTDGNGRFATPRDAAQAADLRDALKACREYLRQFLEERSAAASASTASASSAASSSTYIEEEDSDFECTSDDSPAPRARAAKETARRGSPHHPPPHSPSKMTVAQLRQLLRANGLPCGGAKAVLVERAQGVRGQGAASDDAPNDRASQASHTENSTRHSTSAASSPVLSSPRSSELKSPTSRASGGESKGIWGVLMHAGSRLFRGSGRASWGVHPRPAESAEAEQPTKRRRLSA